MLFLERRLTLLFTTWFEFEIGLVFSLVLFKFLSGIDKML